ncbi:MAG: lysylphosphatidylglycerol synthase transmembrane domain-containing protein [Spirochaetia bacterium]|nr:lysylphosphatidylglycerol synthase transmembrane domain-containing protein [Spirochaetales bacterium]MDX9784541.1 lysylphosphatidylglycerol synthase transmembrane domain-containing protein [Spirochaetia bacterium]
MGSEPRPKKTSQEDRKLLKHIFIAVLAGLFINLLIGLLLDAEELSEALQRASLLLVLLPFAMIFLIFFIDSLRFKLIFYRFKIKISFRDSFFNNMLGYFFSAITPGSLGGQPFQVLNFSKLGIDSATASNVVFSRLLEGNIVQLAIIALFFHRGILMMARLGKGAYILSAGMAATILLTVVLILGFLNPQLLGSLALRLEKSRLGRGISRISRNPHWAEKISAWSEELGKGFKILWKHNTFFMILDILGSALTQMLWALSLYIPLTVLTGSRPPFQDFLLAYCVCGLISLFVPTPGASGSTEASYLLVMGTLTGKPAATLSAILVWRVGSYYLQILVGGIKYFTTRVPRSVYKKDRRGFLRRIRRRSPASELSSAKDLTQQDPGQEGAQGPG